MYWLLYWKGRTEQLYRCRMVERVLVLYPHAAQTGSCHVSVAAESIKTRSMISMECVCFLSTVKVKNLKWNLGELGTTCIAFSETALAFNFKASNFWLHVSLPEKGAATASSAPHPELKSITTPSTAFSCLTSEYLFKGALVRKGSFSCHGTSRLYFFFFLMGMV